VQGGGTITVYQVIYSTAVAWQHATLLTVVNMGMNFTQMLIDTMMSVLKQRKMLSVKTGFG
jgi:hypothetical protein